MKDNQIKEEWEKKEVTEFRERVTEIITSLCTQKELCMTCDAYLEDLVGMFEFSLKEAEQRGYEKGKQDKIAEMHNFTIPAVERQAEQRVAKEIVQKYNSGTYAHDSEFIDWVKHQYNIKN